MSIPEDHFELLKILAESKTAVHFRGIMYNCGKHQTTIRKALDNLKAQGLIQEEARGNRLLYSLTDKGREKLAG
ncbi:MAG: hypothetical protein QXR42_09345 [Candidatus Bathyarchaeia archaeon]